MIMIVANMRIGCARPGHLIASALKVSDSVAQVRTGHFLIFHSYSHCLWLLPFAPFYTVDVILLLRGQSLGKVCTS